ncbi:NUDIX domain-containing protein [Candidatus Uhrbacteria bacterium]|jgi:8-oxo-dGTP diphosphatase|nr:NUDIX domain-containing protein [Candidatus Uhrbacteria bacterium]
MGNDQPKLFVATKAFIVHDGKVLILRESGSYSDGTNSGSYDIPGGRLNPGEHFLDALKREVREETGLSVKVGAPVAANEWRPTVRGEDWQVVGMFFECIAQSNDVTLGEDHDACEWIDPNDYEKYSIIGNLKQVFEAYNKLS